MEKPVKLKFANYLSIGMMIFGLFFGAGNLIFPIQMGQEAGKAVGAANLGFLITAIGLPFLGILAFGFSGSDSLIDLSKKVSHRFSYVFTTILFMIIGPLFALPRLATTSYEVGISTFVQAEYQVPALLLFTCLFFAVTWYLSLNPTKLLDYIGKYLTPLFLILLAILMFLAFAMPMGKISTAPTQSKYMLHPFLQGFLNGYNTLDALAALAFGTVIVTSVQRLGNFTKKEAAIKIGFSGLIGIVLMGIIYTLLSYMGTMSLGEFPLNKNGGITLSQISVYYLGNFGYIIMSVIVLIACLKTAIGLVSAFSQTFTKLYPRVNYKWFCVGATVLAGVVSNIGLTSIIAISTPVLMFIYPLAMLLIFLSLFSQFFENFKAVYRCSIYLTMISAFFEGLNAMPGFVKQQHLIAKLLDGANKYLPLYEYGFSWLLFATIGILVGILLSIYQRNRVNS